MALGGQPNPAPGFLHRLDTIGRGTFPVTSTALLLVVACAPAGLPGLGPALALACVFFWSVFRPAVMPAPMVFGLGVFQDLLSFAPLGQAVLALLLAHAVALRSRRLLVQQSFSVVWLTFSALALLASALSHAANILLSWRMFPIVSALLQAGLSIGVYPAVAAVLTHFHQRMQDAEALT